MKNVSASPKNVAKFQVWMPSTRRSSGMCMGGGPSLPNQEQGEKMDRKVGSGYTNEGSEPKMLIEDNRVALIFS